MNISVAKLMNFYIDTLDKCSLKLLEMSDEDIEYNIFEEFDIGVVSFLHKKTLSKLLNAKLINNNIFNKSLELRSKYIQIRDSDLWEIRAVKCSSVWKELFALSDEIKLMLKNN